MADIDIFNNRAFSAVELSAAVQRTPFRPSLLGSLGIFTPKRVRTTTVAVERKGGKLDVIQTSERGAPLSENDREKRDIRDFRTVRIAEGHTLHAHELQNIVAWGDRSELQAVQTELAEIINGPTGLRSKVELTLERHRLGAVQGIVLDKDGSVIRNWFTEFGIAQPTEVDFDLDNAAPDSGVLRKKLNEITRAAQRAAEGAWIDGQTYLVGLAGDAFWDDFTTHSEVRETYLGQQEAADLRNGVGAAFGTFNYGGVQFINYRGTDDNTTVAVGTNEVKFFPVNAPGLFINAQSPAEFLPFVNTPGQDIYAIIVPDLQRQAWVRPEVYTYPLHICTCPGVLQRGRRT